MRTKLVVVGLAGLLAVLAASCAVPIEDLGGPSSIAWDINDAGVAVGQSATADSVPDAWRAHGFTRYPDGRVVDLPPLAGHDISEAFAIDEAGVAVGWSYAGPGRDDSLPCPSTVVPRAVRWSADGTVTDLGALPGGCTSKATGINAAGVIIGHSATPAGTKAFVLDPDVGELVALPSVPGGSASFARAINDAGIVVGIQRVGSSLRTVQWDLGAGTVVEIPTGLGEVFDINEAGVVAGITPPTSLPDQRYRAAIWRPGTIGATILGVSDHSVAMAINDEGVVVGEDQEPGPAAFRWTEATGVEVLGPRPSGAAGINDAGQIVGSANRRAVIFAGP